MTSQGSRGWPRASLLYGVLVFLVAVLLYFPSLDHSFQFDDHIFLKDDNVRLGRWQAFVWPPVPRFLCWLTYLVQYPISEQNPGAYRAVSLGLHGVNSVWVFALLWLILEQQRLVGRRARPREFALAGALVFATHPLASESVLYIYQRSTLMATLFSLFSLWCWLRQRRDRPVGSRSAFFYRLMATLAFLMAVASKEVALVLPLALWLGEGLLGGNWRPGRLLSIWAAISAAFLAGFLLWAHQTGQTTLAGGAGEVPVYAATQVKVIWSYLLLVLTLRPLNIDHQVAAQTSLADPLWWLVFLGLLLLAWGIRRLAAYEPATAYLATLFFLFLLPTSSLMPSRDFMFEHRLYASLLGFAGVVAGALRLAAGRLEETAGDPPRAAESRWVTSTHRGRLLLRLGVLIYVSLLVFATSNRSVVWSTPLSLWRDATAKSPDKYRTNYNLGVVLMPTSPREAMEYLSRAIEIDPSLPLAFQSLGQVYFEQGQPQQAITLWKQALMLKPNDAETLLALGKAFSSQLDYPSALGYLEAASRLRPRDGDIHYQLALLHLRFGLLAQAIESAERGLAHHPRLAPLRFLLAEAVSQQGNWERALELYREGLGDDPQNAGAWYGLAQTYAKLERTEAAETAVLEGLAVAASQPEIERGKALLRNLNKR